MIRNIAIVPPDTRVYLESAGGVVEEMDEWTRTGGENVLKAVREVLEQKEIISTHVVSRDDFSTEEQGRFDQSLEIFRVVNWAIYAHTYGPEKDLFIKKINRFDYSLGREAGELAGDTQAVLFLWVYDFVPTRGSSVLETVKVVTLKDMAEKLGGKDRANTAISAALVDAADGTILWYSLFRPVRDFYDLRNPKEVKEMVDGLLKYFPL